MLAIVIYVELFIYVYVIIFLVVRRRPLETADYFICEGGPWSLPTMFLLYVCVWYLFPFLS